MSDDKSCGNCLFVDSEERYGEAIIDQGRITGYMECRPNPYCKARNNKIITNSTPCDMWKSESAKRK